MPRWLEFALLATATAAGGFIAVMLLLAAAALLVVGLPAPAAASCLGGLAFIYFAARMVEVLFDMIDGVRQ